MTCVMHGVMRQNHALGKQKRPLHTLVYVYQHGLMPRVDVYKRRYCETVLTLMSEGAALCEVAAHLKVDMATIRKWQDAHVSFARAVEKGETLAESWWSAQGRSGLYDKNFKVSLWATYMKSRFGWGGSAVSGPPSEEVENTNTEAVLLKWQES